MKNCPSIAISEHFEENRKFWPELVFTENFDQKQHFQKFWRKSIFLENFDQNKDSAENVDQNRDNLKF